MQNLYSRLPTPSLLRQRNRSEETRKKMIHHFDVSSSCRDLDFTVRDEEIGAAWKEGAVP